jgi:hypothetical protein
MKFTLVFYVCPARSEVMGMHLAYFETPVAEGLTDH